MSDFEETRCDICDIRLGHDVHCVRYQYSRPKVATIWHTREERLADASHSPASPKSPALPAERSADESDHSA